MNEQTLGFVTETARAQAPLRGLSRRVMTPPEAPGFAGPGHTAVEVLRPTALDRTDPFVLLMDDRIDFGSGRQIGGAHPHAGLETVTLVLDGSIEDRDEGVVSAGDAIWMTAGRGIIHNEHVNAQGYVRVLQLWIGLPRQLRDTEPRFELIPFATLPIRREPGVEARLYSGSSGALSSPPSARTQRHCLHKVVAQCRPVLSTAPDLLVGRSQRRGRGEKQRLRGAREEYGQRDQEQDL